MLAPRLWHLACGTTSGNGSGTSGWPSPWDVLRSHCARWSGEWAPPHPQMGAAHTMAEPAPGEETAYGPLTWARARGGRLGAEAFALQDDGTLRCPHGGELWQTEIRDENAFTRAAHFCGPRR